MNRPGRGARSFMAIAWTAQLASTAFAASDAAVAQTGAGASVADLVKDLRGPDWDRRVMAAAMLGSLGAAAKPALPALLDGLKDPEATVLYRTAATLTLGQIGPEAKEAIPALIELLRARDTRPGLDPSDTDLWHQARANAAYALGHIGPADTAAVIPALLDAVRKERGKIRGLALSSLGSLGAGPDPETRAATPTILQTLEDWKEEAWVRVAAAELLGRIGPAAKSALPGLTRAAQETNAELAKAAADSLKKIEGR